jgi:hypothetical protein
MRSDQVDLQFTNLVACYAHIAQFAHARSDGVGQFIARNNFVDDGACLVHSVPRVRREQGSTTFDRDLADRFKR